MLEEGTNRNKANNPKECFVIMPISDQSNYPKGHFTKIYEQIFKPAIEKAGYVAKRVDEDKMSSDIMTKIFEGITSAEMAICDLSSKNPNAMYELGLRHAYGKPVVLICDDKTERIFDVAGINTVQYKSERLYEDVIEARSNIMDAIISTAKHPHSILNMAKIQSANVEQSNHMDDNDYIKLMLTNIMQDMNDIKNSTMFATRENIIDSDNVRKIFRRVSLLEEKINDNKLNETETTYFWNEIQMLKDFIVDNNEVSNNVKEILLHELYSLERSLKNKT